MMLRQMAIGALLLAAPVCAQTTNDPFSGPIAANGEPIVVDFVELATLPDVDGRPARMMLLVDEPGTDRMFVNDMRGPLYSVSYDGSDVTLYLDVNDPRWGVSVYSRRSETGVQSFALHPEFAEEGAAGYGKLYTWLDTDDTGPQPDFLAEGDETSHYTVLLEWTASDATAATYDGGAPRELLRVEQPFSNHNGGHLTFNPVAEPDDADYGLLYVGNADGGSGGDPFDAAQDLGSSLGKILRIDPLGSNGANGQYGIPEDNPFANDGDDGTLAEIWAYGVRNPQRFGWDPANGNMFVADIGQNIVEELSPVTRGADLGWNDWEGSFGFISRQEVSLENPRGDPSVTYPVAEYGQRDPLLQRSSAATGVHVYRAGDIPELQGLVLFGDNPSGEIFYVDADDLPDGGQDGIGRILLNDGGEAKTFLEVIREKNAEQGEEPADRADLRFGHGPEGQVLLLNKADGVIRLLVGEGS